VAAQQYGRRGPVSVVAVTADSGGALAPVEYAVAAERFLAQSSLSPASRRVYRISLAGWAWPLVGRVTPAGDQRRGARPPVLPLALLDDPGTPARLARAVTVRAATADARTVNREVSALRGAVGWWREQGWIRRDPTVVLTHLARGPVALPALTPPQVEAVLRLPVGVREQALWRVLRDSGGRVDEVLALNATAVDLAGGRARGAGGSMLRFGRPTARTLSWLLAGRPCGPVFLTSRRAPEGTPADDVCPVTGRARMSYRRAAEIFAVRTRPLDPAGRGWTLHQLRAPSSS
jgi:integrase